MPSSRTHERRPGSGPWKLLYWSLRCHPAVVAGFAATLIAVLAFEVYLPRVLGQAIDGAISDRSTAVIDQAGLTIVAVIAGLYIAHVAYIRLETRLLYGAMLRLRALLCRRILEQPLDFFAKSKAGDLTHMVLNDTEVLENHGVYVFSDVPFSLLTILAILGLMMFMDWRMTIVIVGFLAGATALSLRLGRPLPTLRKTIQKISSQLSSRLNEAAGGIRTIRGFGRGEHETQRLVALAGDVAQMQTREGVLGAWVDPLLELVELLGVALIVWYGAHRIVAGAMTPGALVAFIAYMELMSEPVSRVGHHVRHIQVCRGVLDRIAHFLDGLAVASVQGTERPGGERAVRLARTSYRYPGADHDAVDAVSLLARPGELIAIAGPNGAGKSTLMELVLGFREPTAGSIEVSGVRAQNWHPESWHRAIGLSPQDVFLFHAPLVENVAYGKPGASREECEQAARQAGLGPLVKRLPEGLDTVVGDRGQRLSGGERQRVALARLLLADPAIVVLDEPTSALDGQAARDVGNVLRELARTRLVFVIAHRPETLSIATRVVLMDHGAIVFDGSPDGAQAHPLYHRLFTSNQAGGAQVIRMSR